MSGSGRGRERHALVKQQPILSRNAVIVTLLVHVQIYGLWLMAPARSSEPPAHPGFRMFDLIRISHCRHVEEIGDVEPNQPCHRHNGANAIILLPFIWCLAESVHAYATELIFDDRYTGSSSRQQ